MSFTKGLTDLINRTMCEYFSKPEILVDEIEQLLDPEHERRLAFCEVWENGLPSRKYSVTPLFVKIRNAVKRLNTVIPDLRATCYLADDIKTKRSKRSFCFQFIFFRKEDNVSLFEFMEARDAWLNTPVNDEGEIIGDSHGAGAASDYPEMVKFPAGEDFIRVKGRLMGHGIDSVEEFIERRRCCLKCVEYRENKCFGYKADCSVVKEHFRLLSRKGRF